MRYSVLCRRQDRTIVLGSHFLNGHVATEESTKGNRL